MRESAPFSRGTFCPFPATPQEWFQKLFISKIELKVTQRSQGPSVQREPLAHGTHWLT